METQAKRRGGAYFTEEAERDGGKIGRFREKSLSHL